MTAGDVEIKDRRRSMTAATVDRFEFFRSLLGDSIHDLFLRNATAVKIHQQPRLPRDELDDRRGRNIFGGVARFRRRLRPQKRQFDVCIRLRRAGEDLQGRAQHRTLTVGVVRIPKWTTHRVTDSRESRYADCARQIRNHRERNGRDAAGFDHALNQSDGPAAEGSCGHQSSRVHAIGVHAFRNRRRRLSEEHVRF
jgi:hypothetical protein